MKNFSYTPGPWQLYDLLDRINVAFYTRTTRVEWMKLMEESKPLLRRARGEERE